MISNQRRNAMKENAENEEELENENPGWKAFMELRRQVQRGKKRADYLSNCKYCVFAIEPVKKRLFLR